VFLSGSVDKSTYEVKAAEINAELERVSENLTKECKINGEFIRITETSFNVTQNAADSWVGSSWIEKRDLLDNLTLNREIGRDKSLTDLEYAFRRPRQTGRFWRWYPLRDSNQLNTPMMGERRCRSDLGKSLRHNRLYSGTH
jgi:hypothetical protein